MEQIKRPEWIDYLLLCIVVAISGFEYAFRASIFIKFGILIFVFLLFLKRRKKFNPRIFLLISPFIIAYILQAIVFDSYYYGFTNVSQILVDFTLVYLIIVLMGNSFGRTFVNFMFFLTIVSFFLYPTQFFPELQDTIKNSFGSILTPLGSENIPEGFRSNTLFFFNYIHTYGHGTESLLLRNSGPFWEPGMFGVFLCLALIINLFINKVKFLTKKNIVFIIGVITTVSTSAYLILFLIILFHFWSLKNKFKFLLYAPVLLLFISVAYGYVWELDFMREKVEKNIATSKEDRTSRFGAVIYHFEQLKESPLTGVTIANTSADQNLQFINKEVSPNGLSLVFYVFGIPIGIYYFLRLYKGIKNLLISHNSFRKSTAIGVFILILLLAFSQDVTMRLFYIMLICFGFVPPYIIVNQYQKQNETV